MFCYIHFGNLSEPVEINFNLSCVERIGEYFLANPFGPFFNCRISTNMYTSRYYFFTTIRNNHIHMLLFFVYFFENTLLPKQMLLFFCAFDAIIIFGKNFSLLGLMFAHLENVLAFRT